MTPKQQTPTAGEKPGPLYDEISGGDHISVFHHDGDFAKYPNLMRIAKEIVGADRWHRDPTYETRKILHRAIGRMPEFMSGRNPNRPGSEADDNFWKGKPQREAAKILYGFRQKEIRDVLGYTPDDPEYKPRLTYRGDYRPAALKLLSLESETDENNIKRPFRIIWQELEQALLTLEKEAIKRHEEDRLNKKEAEYAVDREALRKQLFKAIEGEGSENLTWVWGDAGTGKTTAVNGALAELIRPIVTIDCELDEYDPNRIDGQLVSVLREYRQLGDGSTADAKRQFCEFLCRPDAPKYVVIENHESGTFKMISDRIWPFVSDVIIISRFPPPKPIEKDANIVTVGDLVSNEATELIWHYIPDASNDDCGELASALYHRVLLLRQASAMLREYGTIREYLDGLQTIGDMQDQFDDLSDDLQRGVGAHYRLMLRELERHEPQTLEVLAVALCVQENTALNTFSLLWEEMHSMDDDVDYRIPDDLRDLIAKTRASVQFPAPDGSISPKNRRHIDKALERLGKFAIVNTSGGRISMHPLARMALCILQVVRIETVGMHAIDALIERTRPWGWRPLETLSTEMVDLVVACFATIYRAATGDFLDPSALSGHDLRRNYVDRRQYAVALLVRACRQQMDGPDMDPFVDGVLAMDDRRILFVDDQKKRLVLNSAGDLAPDVRYAPQVSKSGIACLIAECMTIRQPVDAMSYRLVKRECQKMGFYIPDAAWKAYKKVSVEVGFHKIISGEDLAEFRVSLLRQTHGEGTKREAWRVADWHNILAFGRFFASAGNIESAVRILLTNARDVTSVIGYPEAQWVEVESYRVCSDSLLRAGQVSRAAEVLDEMISMLKDRDAIPSPQRKRFELSDSVLWERIDILRRDIEVTSLVRSSADTVAFRSRIADECRYAYSRCELYKERNNSSKELAFERACQFIRFSMLAMSWLGADAADVPLADWDYAEGLVDLWIGNAGLTYFIIYMSPYLLDFCTFRGSGQSGDGRLRVAVAR